MNFTELFETHIARWCDAYAENDNTAYARADELADEIRIAEGADLRAVGLVHYVHLYITGRMQFE